jgi:hypothetical protein
MCYIRSSALHRGFYHCQDLSKHVGLEFSEYIGCYADQVGDRDLPVKKDDVGSAADPVEACALQCQHGYMYFGLQYDDECFCGNSPVRKHESTSPAAATECDADGVVGPYPDYADKCGDGATVTCQGFNAVYRVGYTGCVVAGKRSAELRAGSTAAMVISGAFDVPVQFSKRLMRGTQGWSKISGRPILDIEYEGCYIDNDEDYTVTEGKKCRGTSPSHYGPWCSMAVDVSLPEAEQRAACFAQVTATQSCAFHYASSAGSCNIHCQDQTADCCEGSSTAGAGGWNPADVYTGDDNADAVMATYRSAVRDRGLSLVPIADRPAACALRCDGYTYFGLQYEEDCWCGNSFGSQGAAAATDCDTDGVVGPYPDYADLCADGSTACSSRSAVYRTVYATGISYVGCYIDSAVHDLTLLKTALKNVPFADRPDACARQCDGYPYFGLQYEEDCWCGNSFGSQGAAAATDCDTDGVVGPYPDYADLCADGSTTCSSRNAVYRILSVQRDSNTYDETYRGCDATSSTATSSGTDSILGGRDFVDQRTATCAYVKGATTSTSSSVRILPGSGFDRKTRGPVSFQVGDYILAETDFEAKYIKLTEACGNPVDMTGAQGISCGDSLDVDDCGCLCNETPGCVGFDWNSADNVAACVLKSRCEGIVGLAAGQQVGYRLAGRRGYRLSGSTGSPAESVARVCVEFSAAEPLNVSCEKLAKLPFPQIVSHLLVATRTACSYKLRP